MKQAKFCIFDKNLNIMKKYFKFITLVIIAVQSLSIVNAQNDSITLVGKLSLTGLPIHDVWQYTDQGTGTSYALLCISTSGLRVIDLSDPANPAIVGTLSGSGVSPIDIKTWQNYAYLVAESPSVSGKIIDLSDPANPALVGSFPAGHNITISDSGYMYVSTPGIRIYDLNTDPENPLLVYTESACQGHDISIIGFRLYDFSWNCGTRIFDITVPDTLVQIGTVPADIGTNHHSGWPSTNGNYLFVCDELATSIENDIMVYDISNLVAPFKVDSFTDPTSYVHNLYVIDNYAYVSYYRAGFRVFDISDPTNISLEAEYDTDSSATGPGYGGNFGLYVFSQDGNILASDEGKGLYIFNFSALTGVKSNTLEENIFSIYPNPTSDLLTIELQNKSFKNVSLKIYDSIGKLVREVSLTGSTTISTKNFEQGIYYMILESESLSQRKPFMVIR